MEIGCNVKVILEGAKNFGETGRVVGVTENDNGIDCYHVVFKSGDGWFVESAIKQVR